MPRHTHSVGWSRSTNSAAQRDLGGVALRVERTGLGRGVGSVARGLDVAAAGDDHAVDGVEDRVDLVAVVRGR